MGGLAAAIELASRGAAVTVCESDANVGGKASCTILQGRPVATGPTVLTMPWVFERLFEHAGLHLRSAVRLQRLDRLARHFWSGGASLDLFPDAERSRDAVGRFAGSADAANFTRFMARSEQVYNTLRDSFLTNTKPGLWTLTRRTGWRDALALQPFTTLWKVLSREFDDPRLQQLFARYATYCGASPLSAPATLMLIAHVEQTGVESVEGGIKWLALGLAEAACRLGAEIHCAAPVRQIVLRRGHAAGVLLVDGTHLPADAVIANCDANALASGLPGTAARRAARSVAPRRRSLSAMTWAALGHTTGADLHYHNVFFSDDYPQEFDELFHQRRVPRNPTVYLCAQDHGSPVNPLAGERLFLLINAPANGDSDTMSDQQVDSCRRRTLEAMANCGVTLTTHSSAVTTPQNYARRYAGSGGALYGRATHGWHATFTRPGNRSAISGLYLAGGTVHPGPGVPMAALSGIQAARCLWNDLTSPSR